MRIRWLALGVLLALLGVAGALVGLWLWKSPGGGARDARPAAPPNAPSAWERVTANIGEHGEVPLDTALRAFSLVFGPLPGVGPLPPIDTSVPYCGTEVMRWVRSHDAELTPAQREAIDRLSRPAAGSHPLAFTAQIRGRTPSEREARSITPHVQAARGLISLQTGHTFNDEVLVTLVPQRVLDADHAWAMAEPRCHRRPLPGGTLTEAQAREYVERLRIPFNELIQGCDCHISLSEELLDLSPALRASIIAHEVFHCFQYDSTLATYLQNNDINAHSSWIIEGGAAWVESQFYDSAVAGSPPGSSEEWQTYMRGNSGWGVWSLFSSNYGAIGFYATLAQNGVDVWRRLLPLTDTPGGSEGMAYMLQGVPSTVLSSLASSATRRDLNSAWSLRGSGLAQTTRRPTVRTDPLRVRPDGEPLRLRAAPSVQRGVEVPIDAAVDLVQVEMVGAGRLVFDRRYEEHWETDRGTAWCLRPTGCACPDGRQPVRGTIEPRPRGVSVTVTLDGGPTRLAGVVLRAVSLDGLCADAGAPDTGEVEACVVGRWQMDTTSARDAWTRVFGPRVNNATLTAMSGNAEMNFLANGVFTQVMREFRAEMRAQQIPTRVTMTGTATGRARTESGELRFRDMDPRIRTVAEVQAVGSWVQIPLPTDPMTLPGISASSARYTCSGNTLTVEYNGEMPGIVWRRQ